MSCFECFPRFWQTLSARVTDSAEANMSPFELFTLPKDIVQNVLLHWIELTTIAKLDSSVCCSIRRPKFRKLVYGPSALHDVKWESFRSRPIERINLVCSWMELRNVYLESFFIPGTSTLEKWLTTIVRSGSTISKLQCLSQDRWDLQLETAEAIANHCPNLKQMFFPGYRHANFIVLDTISANCCNMFRVSFGDIWLATENLEAFASQCSQLTYLQYCPHQINHGCLQRLAVRLPTLVHLHICRPGTTAWTHSAVEGTVLQGADIQALAIHCHQLETLYGPCQELTDAVLHILMEGCPRLRRVQFCAWQRVTPAVMLDATLRLPLVELCVSTDTCSSDMLALMLSHSAERLQEVTLVGGTVGAEYLQPLARCSNMRQLTVHSNAAINPQALGVVCAALPRLHSVRVSGKYAHPDNVALAVVQNCPRLEKLNLTDSYLTDDGLLSLVPHMRRVRVLDITLCNLITAAGLQALGASCERGDLPKLRRLKAVAEKDWEVHAWFPAKVEVVVQIVIPLRRPILYKSGRNFPGY